MNVTEQIKGYINSQAEPKRSEMNSLHDRIVQLCPGCRLWFLDGIDSTGKTVSNPNIGYGLLNMKYAGGKTRETFKISISGNTSGISVYILGIADKQYLSQTFGKALGKASMTGYCIKFKTLKDINMDVLDDVIRYGLEI